SFFSENSGQWLVGSGQWAVLTSSLPTAHCPLTTAHCHYPLCKRLAEAEHMAVTIADREFLHPIRFLNKRAVHHIGALRVEFRVQSLRVVDPEEGVPGSSLLFIRRDKFGRRNPPQHNREAVAAADGELEGSSRRVFTPKAHRLLIERHRLFHVG